MRISVSELSKIACKENKLSVNPPYMYLYIYVFFVSESFFNIVRYIYKKNISIRLNIIAEKIHENIVHYATEQSL